MKFGRRLQEEAYEPYLPHYIAYKELKKAIKLITGADTSQCTIAEVTSNFSQTTAFSGSAQRPPEARFQELLNFEVNKINSFATLVYMTTKTNLSNLLVQIPPVNALDELNGLYATAESAADGVSYLYAFVQLNLIGFRKITKKYDKHSRGNSSTWYMTQLLKESFVNLNFDVLIHGVAQCFQLFYQQKMKLCGLQVPSEPFISRQLEASRQENTIETTHLVSEDDIMQARLYLTKYLPLISTDQNFKKTSQPSVDMSRQLTAESRSTKLSVDEKNSAFKNPSVYAYQQQRISHGSIFFDNPTSFATYRAYLDQCQKTQQSRSVTPPTHSQLVRCLRFRWPIAKPLIKRDEEKPINSSQINSCSIQMPIETFSQSSNNLCAPGITSFERTDSQPPKPSCMSPRSTCLSENALSSTYSFDSILLEFIDPACNASNPSEWFELPFDNHLDTCISDNAVLLSISAAEELLKNELNISNFITQQKQLHKGDLSEKRIKAMTDLLHKAVHFIHELGHVPMLQRWCHRTSYRGNIIDYDQHCKGDPNSQCINPNTADNFEDTRSSSDPSVRPRQIATGSFDQKATGSFDQKATSSSDQKSISSTLVKAYLDENIRFVLWNQSSNMSLADQIHEVSILSNPSTVKLPYGILSMERTIPMEFLLRLMGSITIAEVFQYSTFLHGTSLLYRQRFSRAEIPQWFKIVFQFNLHDKEPQKKDSLLIQKSPSHIEAYTHTPSDPIRVDVMPMRPNEKILYNHVATEQLHDGMPPKISDLARAVIPKKFQESMTTHQYDSIMQNGLASLRQPLRQASRISSQDYSIERPSRARSLWIRLQDTVKQAISSWTNVCPPQQTVECQESLVRVEPKTFFANERTLLQWMNTAVLISTISVTLLNFASRTGRIAGFLLAPIAIFFILYSFAVYIRRNRCLKKRKPIDYGDQVGPAVLVISLSVALTIIIVLDFWGNSPVSNPRY